MSEFKFGVGDRVAVRCKNHGYLRGTIKVKYRVEGTYAVKPDEKYNVLDCLAERSELTRLVKKNPWGKFKVGMRVLADSTDLGKFTGRIVELFKSTLTGKATLKIKPDKSLNIPYGLDTWCVLCSRCKLIEDEKPKPKREPLRVGERVVVRKGNDFGYYTTAEDGDKGIVSHSAYIQHPEDKVNIFVKLDNGREQYLNPKHLRRLIKKPVAFKVGDRVRVKRIWDRTDIAVPFDAIVIEIFFDNFKDRIHVSTAEGKTWYVKEVDCVRLRKKPVVFAVGDRVIGKGNSIFTGEKGVVEKIDPVRIKFDMGTLTGMDIQNIVKLRERRLRVGDRVIAIDITDNKIKGEIIDDDGSLTPFRIRKDVGLTTWAAEKNCKRLVRKKKIKSSIPDCKSKYPHNWFEYLKYVTALFGNKNNGDNKGHIPASGKKVDDHFAGVGKKVGDEFCECHWKRGYDECGRHVQNVITEEDFAKNKSSANPCYKEIKRHRQDDFLIASHAVPEKRVCNPALWETQHITNIAQAKLINELIRKVERIETENHIACCTFKHCKQCKARLIPYVDICPKCDDPSARKK